MYTTKNFNPLVDVKLSCTCGSPECDKRTVNRATLNKLQVLRDLLNMPVIVTSGGRCPHHHSEVHRSKPADHQNCIGVDIAFKNEVHRNLIMLNAVKAGFTAIACGKTFVHVGNRPQEHITTWSYK